MSAIPWRARARDVVAHACGCVCAFVRVCVCLIMHLQDLLLQEPNQRENERRCAKRTSLVGQREELQVSWARLFVWVSSVGVMLLCRTRR
jgi:hypothetical protein